MHDVFAHHDHSSYPEKEDVVAGDEGGCWVELFQISRFIWPAKGAERP